MVRFPRKGILLLALLLLSGCDLFQTPRPTPSPPPRQQQLPAPSSEILAFFPQEPYTVWFADGYAEYGHRMTIDAVDSSGISNRIHYISGWVEDVSSGESTRSFYFKLSLNFTPTALRETVIQADTPFPHKVPAMTLLQLPLTKGARWEETVTVMQKKEVLKAEIIDARTDPATKLRVLEVRYQVPMINMPGGIYEEVREYVQGKGIVRLENTFGPEPGSRFNYALREIDPSGPRSVYQNIAYKVRLSYPSGWQRVDDTRYQGKEGFFLVNAAGGESIEAVANSEAQHRINPYGTRPIVEDLKVQTQPARLVLPSGDQAPSMKNQAALIVQYPKSIALSGQTYQYLVLYADKYTINSLAATVVFLP